MRRLGCRSTASLKNKKNYMTIINIKKNFNSELKEQLIEEFSLMYYHGQKSKITFNGDIAGESYSCLFYEVHTDTLP
jgi:hypothetical protein